MNTRLRETGQPASLSRFEQSLRISPTAMPDYKLETLVQPARLYGSNGIRFAPDGRLWICEGFARRVSSCDVNTGEVAVVIPISDLLIAPDDIAFDSEGSAYITDATRITCRRPDGTVFVLTDGLEGANGITVDSDGRLFVNEFRRGGRLFEIDRYTGEKRVIVERLDFPNAMERGPDGQLYLQNVVMGTIHAVDTESGSIVDVVTEGLEQISSVKFDPRGRIVAAQSTKGVVTAIDLDTGEHATVARMPGGGIDNIDFDADGNMYVSSYATGCILRVRPDGDPDGEIVLNPGILNVSFIAPFDSTSVLVANTTSTLRAQLDGTFSEWSVWNGFTLETSISSVWPIDETHAYLHTRGGTLYRIPQGLIWPVAVRMTGDDNPVVMEGVTAITGDGDDLFVATEGGRIGRLGKDAAQLEAVTQVDLDAVTSLAVRGGSIVAASKTAGTVVVIRGDEVMSLSGFGSPTGVAIVDDGIFIAECEGRLVSRWNPTSDVCEPVATDLPLGLPVPSTGAFGSASLIALEDGSVLVGCDGDGSIRRLSPRERTRGSAHEEDRPPYPLPGISGT